MWVVWVVWVVWVAGTVTRSPRLTGQHTLISLGTAYTKRADERSSSSSAANAASGNKCGKDPDIEQGDSATAAAPDGKLRGILGVYGAVIFVAGILVCLVVSRKLPVAVSFTKSQKNG